MTTLKATRYQFQVARLETAKSDGEGRRAETADETVQSQEFETGEIYGTVHREIPIPAVRRSKLATAGVHTSL